MAITFDNKHCVIAAASLLASFHLYRTVAALFANAPPTTPSNGFSVQVERGLGELDPESELGKGVDEVYPPDAFPGGSDVRLPNGRIKYFLLGPADGKKVCSGTSSDRDAYVHLHSRSYSCMGSAAPA